jgi:hypothetical protein
MSTTLSPARISVVGRIVDGKRVLVISAVSDDPNGSFVMTMTSTDALNMAEALVKASAWADGETVTLPAGTLS